jgi:hypothetical protein
MVEHLTAFFHSYPRNVEHGSNQRKYATNGRGYDALALGCQRGLPSGRCASYIRRYRGVHDPSAARTGRRKARESSATGNTDNNSGSTLRRSKHCCRFHPLPINIIATNLERTDNIAWERWFSGLFLELTESESTGEGG